MLELICSFMEPHHHHYSKDVKGINSTPQGISSVVVSTVRTVSNFGIKAEKFGGRRLTTSWLLFCFIGPGGKKGKDNLCRIWTWNTESQKRNCAKQLFWSCFLQRYEGWNMRNWWGAKVGKDPSSSMRQVEVRGNRGSRNVRWENGWRKVEGWIRS